MSTLGPAEQATDAVGEPSVRGERAARAALYGVALLALWGAVAALPELAYVIVGILACRAWDKARAWYARRGRSNAEDQAQTEDLDVAAALRSLAGAGRNVLLTELRGELGVADTKAVRELLDAAGIRVRSGVRTPAGNGPGVHQDDIPDPFPDQGTSQGGRCSCRSAANANANNAGRGPAEEGLRVERIGLDGIVIYDSEDPARYHRVRTSSTTKE
ncbi:hypothetical protein BX257_4759 [Streptomyces sp. 3212.3]|uniref:hypothetical protein n=1 Tax=Streptomyces sp. 3212.3 TaxID=1938846 RepID=UPI000E23EDD9|nr:hypothetical protein [Streptomyces sp. 3212.3]REE62146.1 hypothetical protein BX257_4759 [Streptomyces sp. 3212.3]